MPPWRGGQGGSVPMARPALDGSPRQGTLPYAVPTNSLQALKGPLLPSRSHRSHQLLVCSRLLPDTHGGLDSLWKPCASWCRGCSGLESREEKDVTGERGAPEKKGRGGGGAGRGYREKGDRERFTQETIYANV
ncbi:unnamed protein product [Eretmochelys imbricata]